MSNEIVFKFLALEWLRKMRLLPCQPWQWDGRGYEAVSLPIVNRIYPKL
jgi:hypothetical protein